MRNAGFSESKKIAPRPVLFGFGGTRDINWALESGWKGLDIGEIIPLDQIAHAHELVEHAVKRGA